MLHLYVGSVDSFINAPTKLAFYLGLYWKYIISGAAMLWGKYISIASGIMCNIQVTYKELY